LRTSRLDLDDYNHEAEEGLHITSMAGTWMSLVEGFGGVRITEKGLQINPSIPTTWASYSFQLLYLNLPIHITVSKNSCIVKNKSQKFITFKLHEIIYELESSQEIKISY
jgi:maltose phosphorylase